MSENLDQNVKVSRQFLRSVNLEADLGRSDALQGYICQDTATSLIKTMAHHLNQTKQRAFTWTGPYGGGKSSLALVLGSLVSPDKDLRSSAKKILNVDFTNQNKLEHILTNKSKYGALLITSQNVLKAIAQLNIKIGKKNLTWILLGLKSKPLWSESKHGNFVKI
jgi:hypothetical protein